MSLFSDKMFYMVETDQRTADSAESQDSMVTDVQTTEPELLVLQRMRYTTWDVREALLAAVAAHVQNGHMQSRRISSADTTGLRDAKENILSLLKERGMDDAKLIAARMVVEELIVDAAKYGGAYVQVTFGYDGEYFGILVEDSGKGIDLRTIPNPCHPRNLANDHGRGFFLTDYFLGANHLQGEGLCLPQSPSATVANQFYIRIPMGKKEGGTSAV